MSLSLGIVGLPNVGKSTLFNALVKNGQAEASNYPFCTIDPNVGLVEVPDERLHALAELVKPQAIIPAMVEFYDIAGIIKGASKGEGLGNKFLAHIRETAAIILVARFFTDPNVIHVQGELNPKADLETVLLELILADLETIVKVEERYAKQARTGGKEVLSIVKYLEAIHTALDQQKPASTVKPTEPEHLLVLKEAQLLTSKPMLIVANVNENEATVSAQELFEKNHLEGLVPSADWIIPISAKLEAELVTLPPDEQAEFLSSYGLAQSGLKRLTKQTYTLLGLQSYFTAGPKEVRAWTISIGAKAPEAAGVIHTDFSKGFIRAEVIAYEDYVKYRGEQGSKEAGKMRLEGKEYVMADGDVVHFRFNV